MGKWKLKTSGMLQIEDVRSDGIAGNNKVQGVTVTSIGYRESIRSKLVKHLRG